MDLLKKLATNFWFICSQYLQSTIILLVSIYAESQFFNIINAEFSLAAVFIPFFLAGLSINYVTKNIQKILSHIKFTNVIFIALMLVGYLLNILNIIVIMYYLILSELSKFLLLHSEKKVHATIIKYWLWPIILVPSILIGGIEKGFYGSIYFSTIVLFLYTTFKSYNSKISPDFNAYSWILSIVVLPIALVKRDLTTWTDQELAKSIGVLIIVSKLFVGSCSQLVQYYLKDIWSAIENPESTIFRILEICPRIITATMIILLGLVNSNVIPFEFSLVIIAGSTSLTIGFNGTVLALKNRGNWELSLLIASILTTTACYMFTSNVLLSWFFFESVYALGKYLLACQILSHWRSRTNETMWVIFYTIFFYVWVKYS